jgi:probable blue pigment (indigoidine) exporter
VKTRGGQAALTLLAPIAWGTTYVTVTELFPLDRPLFVATTRVLPAGLMLVALAAAVSRWRYGAGGTRSGAAEWRLRGAEWGRAATLALFNFGLFFPLLSVAVYRLPGGIAAVVGGLQPLLVAGLSRLVAGRRPGGRELMIGVAAAAGVALVVLRPGAQFDPLGVVAAVAANASFAMGVILSKRFPAPINQIAWTGWQLILSALVLGSLTVAVEGVPSTLDGRAWAGMGHLSLIGTAAAFILWFNGIRRLPVAAPPLLGLAAPVTGALLGWIILGQSLSPPQLAGFAITLSAIAYGALLAPPRETAPANATVRAVGPHHANSRCGATVGGTAVDAPPTFLVAG